MSEHWKPIWVQRIDTQITECETDRKKYRAMGDQCDARLRELKDKRRPWTEIEEKEASGAE
jgi:hypothetical protein